MDSSQTKDIWYFAGQLWSSLVVALAVYGGGLTASSIMRTLVPPAADLLDGKVKDADSKLPLYFRLWWSTRHAHPFFAGAAFGSIPGLPHPEWVTSHTATAVWFALMGMLNGQIAMLGDQVFNFARRYGESLAKKRLGLSSTPPAPAPVPATDPTPSADSTQLPSDTQAPKDGT